jgi:hypothetical protein
MTSPRHLWSGDWERESAAAEHRRQELPRIEQPQAEQAPVEQPRVEPPRVVPPRVTEPRVKPPRAKRRRVKRPRVKRPSRLALIAVSAALLSGAAAFAIVAAVGGSRPNGGGRPWLGVQLSSSPILAGGFQSGFGGFPFADGAQVTSVTPGGPAAVAGIVAGDVITQIGQQLITSPAAVQSAIAGMHAGDRVLLRYQQGPLLYSTQVTLQASQGH